MKTAGLGADVIAPMAGRDVLIVEAAFKHQIACGGDLAGAAVVGNGVRPQRAVSELNFDLTAQGINITSFFLRARLDCDRLAFRSRNWKLLAQLALGFALLFDRHAGGLRLADN